MTLWGRITGRQQRERSADGRTDGSARPSTGGWSESASGGNADAVDDAFFSNFGDGAETAEASDTGPRLDFSTLGSIRADTVGPALGVYTRRQVLGPAAGVGGIDPGDGSGGDGVDYIFAEEFQEYRHKSWGEQLTFWAGVSYLSGVTVGGVLGLREGLARGREMVAQLSGGGSGGTAEAGAAKSAGAAATSEAAGARAASAFKLRANALLNAVGRRASRAGNAAGILAICFSAFESILFSLRDETDDALNYVGAGALTGVLYKSTMGLRTASKWSAGLAAVGLIGLYGARQGVYGRRIRQLL